MRTTFAALFVAASLCASAASAAETTATHKIRIGLSMDTLKEERWQRDRDLFVARAAELGAEVIVQSANSNDTLQISQAENLLTQGIDVLVVIPHNGVAAAKIVEAAHKAGKKVLAYDRLINNSDVDLYVSFDNFEIGRMQAKYLLDHAPKGNYVLIGGAPTDNNAHLYHDGAMEILAPAVKRGDVKIVAEQWAKDWQPSEAMKHVENALTKAKDDVQAVVAPNDGTAGGAVAALKGQNLAGKVLVSGQDADLAACQRIAEGTQTMTVYKPIKQLATTAAEAAVTLAKNEPITQKTIGINNGKKDIPSILLAPIGVDKLNLATTVVKDGYQAMNDVYKNVPKDQWPKL